MSNDATELHGFQNNWRISFEKSSLKDEYIKLFNDAFVNNQPLQIEWEEHLLGMPTNGFILNPRYLKSIRKVHDEIPQVQIRQSHDPSLYL